MIVLHYHAQNTALERNLTFSRRADAEDEVKEYIGLAVGQGLDVKGDFLTIGPFTVRGQGLHEVARVGVVQCERDDCPAVVR